MGCQAPLGPDYVTGAVHFLFNRKLRSRALGELLRRPTSRCNPSALSSFRAGNADDAIEPALRRRLEEQGDDDDGSFYARSAPFSQLGQPRRLNAGMQNGLKLRAGGRIGENNPSENIPAQPLRGIQNRPSESGDNFRESRSPRFDELPRQGIRINHRNPVPNQQVRAGGLAHADSAGKTINAHAAGHSLSRRGSGILRHSIAATVNTPACPRGPCRNVRSSGKDPQSSPFRPKFRKRNSSEPAS